MWEFLNGSWQYFEGHQPLAPGSVTVVAPLSTPALEWFREPDDPTGTTETPNIQLLIPATDSHDWEIGINADLLQIDALLSGHATIPALNVTGPSSIPLLSTWSTMTVYAAGQTVIYGGALYSSLVAANLNNQPDISPVAWTPTVEGAQGPAGPTGPPGAPGGSFTYIQSTPSTTWTIAHGLNTFPNVTVTDSAGSWVIGSVQYPTLNQVVLTFSAAFSGTAVLV